MDCCSKQYEEQKTLQNTFLYSQKKKKSLKFILYTYKNIHHKNPWHFLFKEQRYEAFVKSLHWKKKKVIFHSFHILAHHSLTHHYIFQSGASQQVEVLYDGCSSWNLSPRHLSLRPFSHFSNCTYSSFIPYLDFPQPESSSSLLTCHLLWWPSRLNKKKGMWYKRAGNHCL